MRLPLTLRRSQMLESYPTLVLNQLRPRRPHDRPPFACCASNPNGKQISNSRYIGTMPTLDSLTPSPTVKFLISQKQKTDPPLDSTIFRNGNAHLYRLGRESTRGNGSIR